MSADEKLSEYFVFRQTTKALVSIIGLWPLKNPSLFYRLLPYACIFVCSVTSFAILGFVFRHITHISIVVRGMSIGTSIMSGVIKISCVLLYRERAAELHYCLDERFSECLRVKQLSKLILIDITKVRRLCWILISNVSIAVVIYILSPIINIVNQKRQNNGPVHYPLIYPGVYPWDVSHGIIYQIHYIIETLASVTIFCIIAGLDALFACYIFQVNGRLRVMSYRLTHFDENEDMEVVIKECVDEYEVLLRCRDSMQKIFGPMILWMMGTNAVILCALIFQLSQDMRNISIFHWIRILSYLLLKVLQTFLYSWSGSTLITQSQKYRQAIYDADWQSKRNIGSSIVIMLCQRPLNLLACKIFILSLDIFVMILNTTASYYFLLRTLEQKS